MDLTLVLISAAALAITAVNLSLIIRVSRVLRHATDIDKVAKSVVDKSSDIQRQLQQTAAIARTNTKEINRIKDTLNKSGVSKKAKLKDQSNLQPSTRK